MNSEEKSCTILSVQIDMDRKVREPKPVKSIWWRMWPMYATFLLCAVCSLSVFIPYNEIEQTAYLPYQLQNGKVYLIKTHSFENMPPTITLERADDTYDRQYAGPFDDDPLPDTKEILYLVGTKEWMHRVNNRNYAFSTKESVGLHHDYDLRITQSENRITVTGQGKKPY